MADITLRTPICDDDDDCERGKRGKRGKRGHDGPPGPPPVPVVQTLPDSGGCVSPDATVVRFNTDTAEPLIYLASVAAGADGRLVTFIRTSGFLDATLLPDNLSEGINGPPGSTYTFPALDDSATFQADIAGNIWQKVAGSP